MTSEPFDLGIVFMDANNKVGYVTDRLDLI